MYKCVICDIDYPGYDSKNPESILLGCISEEKQFNIDIVFCWYCGLDMCYSCFGKCPCVSNKFKGPINKPWKLYDAHLGVKGDNTANTANTANTDNTANTANTANTDNTDNTDNTNKTQLSTSRTTYCLSCSSCFGNNYKLYKTFECLNCHCNICTICYVIRIVICRYCEKKMCIGCTDKCDCQK
jgi:hypothetical protein